jgi:hypothetical protein
MFGLDGGLAFANEDTPAQLKDAFAALLETLDCSPRCSGRPYTDWRP